MAVSDSSPLGGSTVWTKPASIRLVERHRLASFVLAGLLIAFTLSTLDGGDAAPQLVSAVLLVGFGLYLFLPPAANLVVKWPAVILGVAALYAAVQTLFLREKPTYEAWSGVLFWLTAAAIAFLACQIFQDQSLSALFRQIFVFFGSGLCVLELLEQASKTDHYFWLIPSKYPAVYGSFAYWNNFAQFVELLLPVTLWAGLSKKRPDVIYLLLAAVQLGAVAASGSRAGSALVVCELVVTLVLVFLKNRNRTFLYAAAATLVLSALFVYSAGVGEVMQKLHRRDQLAERRNVDESSLAMIAERPVAGWGQNSYLSVYPRFARFDEGLIVNRAHNDWLQWAAEGGICFAGLMLFIFIWSIRPAVQTIWGIGLIAICVHALVDYPFARLGVCGWYFALLGMVAVWRPPQRRKHGHANRRASSE